MSVRSLFRMAVRSLSWPFGRYIRNTLVAKYPRYATISMLRYQLYCVVCLLCPCYAPLLYGHTYLTSSPQSLMLCMSLEGYVKRSFQRTWRSLSGKWTESSRPDQGQRFFGRLGQGHKLPGRRLCQDSGQSFFMGKRFQKRFLLFIRWKKGNSILALSLYVCYMERTPPFQPLFLYSNGLIPVYRLKYLPKNEISAQFKESEIAWTERPVSLSCDFAFMITMPEIILIQVFPVDFFTMEQR